MSEKVNKKTFGREFQGVINTVAEQFKDRGCTVTIIVTKKEDELYACGSTADAEDALEEILFNGFMLLVTGRAAEMVENHEFKMAMEKIIKDHKPPKKDGK